MDFKNIKENIQKFYSDNKKGIVYSIVGLIIVGVISYQFFPKEKTPNDKPKELVKAESVSDTSSNNDKNKIAKATTSKAQTKDASKEKQPSNVNFISINGHKYPSNGNVVEINGHLFFSDSIINEGLGLPVTKQNDTLFLGDISETNGNKYTYLSTKLNPKIVAYNQYNDIFTNQKRYDVADTYSDTDNEPLQINGVPYENAIGMLIQNENGIRDTNNIVKLLETNFFLNQQYKHFTATVGLDSRYNKDESTMNLILKNESDTVLFKQAITGDKQAAVDLDISNVNTLKVCFEITEEKNSHVNSKDDMIPHLLVLGDPKLYK